MVDQAVRSIDPTRLRAFRDGFAGEMVLPGDETLRRVARRYGTA